MVQMTDKYIDFTLVIKYLILFIPAVIYFYYVQQYAVNIPWQDDYGAILDFLLKYKTAHGVDKFWLLFSQHNEHRILSSRIVYVIYYNIFGNVNFRNVIFIGDAQVVFILIIIISFIRKLLPDYWFIPSLVTSFCLFDLNNWENANFAMASMQNYGVIFLFCLSLFFYTKEKNVFILLAILVQLMVVFSSGNGIVASACIVGYAVISKSKLKIIVSSLALLVSAPLYFLHYNTPPTGHAATDFSKVLVYFFNLAGAHIASGELVARVLLGIGSCAVLLPLVIKKPRFEHNVLPLLSILSFLLGSMLVTSVFRCNVAGVPATSSRYLVYPNFLAAIIFILLAYKLNGRIYAKPALLIVAVLMFILYNTDRLHEKGSLASMRAILTGTDYFYPDKEVAKEITDNACQQGIYCIDNYRQKKQP